MTLRALWPVTQQFQNKNGSILAAGRVYVYYKNRTALATTYHDQEGTVVNANPVLLDNNGRATVFADTIYSYTIVVCDYYGKELFSQDITLHDAISTAEDVMVMGSNGSVQVDTTTLPNGVQYDLSVNTDIIATKESVDNVKTDLNNLTDTVNNHTTQIGQIQEDIVGIESTLANKKDKQNELNFNGSATKTIKSITQNANGELNVEFTNIAGGGGPIYVAHDGTMTGDGTDEMPLSIQSALDVSNANTAPKYDPTSIYPTVGTLCTYGNVLYRSKVAINEAEEWTEEHWEVDSVASELEELKEPPTWEDISSKFMPTSVITVVNKASIKINKSLGLLYINIDINGNFYRSSSSVTQMLFTKSSEISNLTFPSQYGIYRNSSTGKYEMPYQVACRNDGLIGWLPEQGISGEYVLVTAVIPIGI